MARKGYQDTEEQLQSKVCPPYFLAYSCLSKTLSITYAVEKYPTGKEPQCNTDRLYCGQGLATPCGFAEVWFQHTTNVNYAGPAEAVSPPQILIREGEGICPVLEDPWGWLSECTLNLTAPSSHGWHEEM